VTALVDSGVADKYMPGALEALKAFPIVASNVELVWNSENITFRVTDTKTGSDYVLRLHRPGYHTLSELNSERAWTTALADAGIATQSPLLTHGGEHFHAVEVSGEDERFAGMTVWVEGTMLREILESGVEPEEKRRSYTQLGALAAAIHNQSDGWSAPQGFERHSLNSEGLMGDAPFWGRFWEHPRLTQGQKELLLRTREKIRKALHTYGQAPSTYGMIHADLHSENVLVSGGVVTPIDFDDAGYGWHMYELAVALFDERSDPDFEVLKEALVEGYRKHRTLDERDLALLPMFQLIRGMAIIGWVYQRPEHGETSYFGDLMDGVCAMCESFEPVI
jgi:Ser/Thr protein kinase RdoA (MazF antagonist)